MFPEERLIYPLIEYPIDWTGLDAPAFLTFKDKEEKLPIIFFRKTIKRNQINRIVRHEMVHLIERNHSDRFKKILEGLK